MEILASSIIKSKGQIISLFGSYDSEAKWYVVPSSNHPYYNDKIQKELKETMSPEAYFQDIECGIITRKSKQISDGPPPPHRSQDQNQGVENV